MDPETLVTLLGQLHPPLPNAPRPPPRNGGLDRLLPLRQHRLRRPHDGLKQGGVYWYYYRLDDDVEAYDDLQACTAGCPLMPGQMMNVMEVPSEVMLPPSRARSVGCEGMAGMLGGTAFSRKQTMEPSDKFAVLDPPPISRVHGRCLSDLALNGRLENRVPSSRKSVVSLVPSNDTDVAQVEALDYRPSKRRCSDDRPGSAYHSSRSELSLVRHYQLASVEDAHPDPLRSLPVGQDTDDPFRLRLEAFQFGLEQFSASAEAGERNTGDDESKHGGTGSVYGPSSVHNVQMYGSPMSRACDADPEWRPRLYSLPSESLIERHALGVLEPCAPGGALATAQSLDFRDELGAANLTLLDDRDEVLPHSHTLPNLSVLVGHGTRAKQGAPDIEPFQDDIWSPAFSAATVSSAGLDSPFRLSGTYPLGTTSPTHTNDPHGVNEITRRLQALGTISSDERRPEEAFTGYALPPSAMDSVSSLGKLSSQRHGSVATHEDIRVLGLVVQGGDSSIADDIFSELGYLGASIT
ncbi:hypothetical protein LTR91_008228 [Friedmanniomyces endolithicus]|uniref:Uncharacterized protein n=1 Tax=Friedmanniomyces endolithicus TaxID=329885 RepID=A0AAN6KPZ9_9PEZI|nr:hypothetical protein LTR94_012033 [Friedmanniomyces endolithicus]KAK0791787.1 hypothetical protein LTR38_010107 [Friedmanniomyces endolithicus]KAK0801431.1 hypothetical protein LTR75_008574 [Friedmanniomyces endolithicus]KAK0802394.1 hypothetical protein LTR59_005130 [Friedmanniomyces endolithicus]KAK0838440.1 hypothetical protein LTR03_012035 [Friedmanniomyces endolithicus]